MHTRASRMPVRTRHVVDHYVIAFQLLMAVILLPGHTRAIMHVYERACTFAFIK